MGDIAQPYELAWFIQTEVDDAAALFLLELAQGLVVEEIGVQDPWPSTAKAVVLAAAGRAYLNPEGIKSESVGAFTVDRGGSVAARFGPAAALGVYLTDDEVARLHRQTETGYQRPVASFPAAQCWPDRIYG